MPLLQINTNIAIEDPASVVKDASKLVADILGKPESYVMVILNPELNLIFAGSDEAAAHLKLKSLGLSESETSLYSKQLCGFMEQKLSIKPARTYIEFSSPPRHMWGWDNSTF
jgi:phenylpyruvate tautomerase PptA (4-oxalocrotonate tautomerase family)